MKVMKWSRDHKDIYIYLPEDEVWLKIKCIMGDKSLHCTAPQTLPRGTKFDYSIRDTFDLTVAADDAIALYEQQKGD